MTLTQVTRPAGVIVVCVVAVGLTWHLRRESRDSPASVTFVENEPAASSDKTPTGPSERSNSGPLRRRSSAVNGRSGMISAPVAAVPRLSDIASSVGIDFVYFADFRADRFLLPENMGGGAAWIDYDGDGRLDLFLNNGCTIPLDPSDRTHLQQLFRQDAAGRFVPVAAQAGVDLAAYGQGCAAGDIDNDGFPDLVVTCYGQNMLLGNNGDGTFIDRTESAGIADPGWSTSAALGDVDRDGALDLYVAHYAVISLATNPVCFYAGPTGKVRGYCGPDKYQAEPDSLFWNENGLQFARVNDELMGGVKPSKGLGVVFADVNNDGWPDIYVANDMEANFLFLNHGSSKSRSVTFSEIGMISGCAVSGDGVPEASMGVACADFDEDDDLDLFLTHYYQQKNTYYQNFQSQGPLRFEDRSAPTGLAGLAGGHKPLGFGTVPIDYDLDGWQDLFVTNGHVLGKFVKPYAMQPQLFRNQGKARFVEVKPYTSQYFRDQWVGRGAAMADYENDGDEDVVVVHQEDGPVALLRNDTARAAAVIGFEFVGTQSNRTGVGTRVHVRAGDAIRMRELIGGGSYLSSNDPRILVALEPGQSHVTVDVSWPSGRVDHWDALESGRYWRLYEGCAPRASTGWANAPDGSHR